MLPPPAPTERTSIFGRPSRSPAIGASVVRIRLRARIAETSKVVPPMSMTTMSGSSESASAAMGASVGPLITAWIGRAAISPTVIMPPWQLATRSVPAKPASRTALSSRPR